LRLGQDITLQGNRLPKCESFKADDTDAEVHATTCVPLFVFRHRASHSLGRNRREAVFLLKMFVERLSSESNNEREFEMLVKCVECGQDVSSDAKTCPHCGVSLKKPFFKTLGASWKKSLWQLCKDPRSFFSLDGSTTRTEMLAIWLITPTLPLLVHIPLVMLAPKCSVLIAASTVLVALLACLQYPACVRRCHSIGLPGWVIIILQSIYVIADGTWVGRIVSFAFLGLLLVKPIPEEKQFHGKELPYLYVIAFGILLCFGVATGLDAIGLLEPRVSFR